MNAAIPSPAQDERKRNFYILATALAAALGSFFIGYDGAILSAALTYARDYFHWTPSQTGNAMSFGIFGCMAGPLFGGWICDRFGREKTMMAGAALMGFGSLITAVAPTTDIFITFRIVCGVAAGLIAVASPMYIAEVVPAAIRGKLGLGYQLAIVVGSAVAPLAAYPISLLAESQGGAAAYLSGETTWRLMMASQLMILPPFLYFLFQLPPSPRWLADKGRFTEALEVLKKVHEPHLADQELVEIRSAVKTEEGGWGELLQPGLLWALLIGGCLAFFNNWTGWSAMGGYITVLVEMSGVKSHSSAILQFACTYGVMTVMTILSMWLVDRMGRRPLWITASFMMAVVTLATGFVFHYHMHGAIVLLVLSLCAVPHGIALGGLPWLMMSELYPNRVRAKAVTLNTMFLFTVIFSCSKFFPIFADYSTREIGSVAGVFWLFTGICVFSALFGMTIMPETKGRTLEDISSSMGRH